MTECGHVITSKWFLLCDSSAIETLRSKEPEKIDMTRVTNDREMRIQSQDLYIITLMVN